MAIWGHQGKFGSKTDPNLSKSRPICTEDGQKWSLLGSEFDLLTYPKKALKNRTLILRIYFRKIKQPKKVGLSIL